MVLIRVAQLRPGQVVASPLTTPAGALLCPQGFRLTASAIQRIRRSGVDEVVIMGMADPAADIESRLAALDERFAEVDDPILLQLKAAVGNRLTCMRLELEEA